MRLTLTALIRCAFTIGWFLCVSSANANGNFVQIELPKGITVDYLIKMAEQSNKQLPKLIDEDTRLDYIKAGPGLYLTYNYTLVGFPSTSRVPEAFFLKDMRDRNLSEFCSNQGMLALFKKGTTFVFSYKTADGGFYPNISITPKDCGFGS